MNKLIIGTRSSNLALTQTKFVIKKLKEIEPTIDFVIRKIKTKGDILLDKDLNNILDKGFFVSEIQNELINIRNKFFKDKKYDIKLINVYGKMETVVILNVFFTH